ncbi:MAG: BON domain-containing protein [Nitriliruptorales bacterium]|nr:BON domain-containing protein [Nitriliruptorales bacterium]
MAFDPDQTDIVREALQAADTVDAHNIHVAAIEDAVVLRGSVATFEEVSAAAAIAEQHADVVRSELTVDGNLRESGDATESPSAPTAHRDATGSSFNPVETPDDLVTDMQESLEENVPWDPPHEAVQVPTRAEERGVADRADPQDAGGNDPALDQAADPEPKSLPDVSPEELARSANPEPRDEEDSRS